MNEISAPRIFSSTIETKRLILRGYQENDRDDYLALVTDPQVMAHIEPVLPSKKTASAWFATAVERSGPRTQWCVRLKHSDSYAGHAMINEYKKEASYELGYLLIQTQWNQGFATEIARALAAFSRDQLKILRIYATVEFENTGSINVLEKTGFKRHSIDSDENGEFCVYVLVH